MVTINASRPALPADDERSVVTEIARQAVERAAPEELPIFADTAADYFRDPRRALSPQRRDEAVGFGVELALLTPYALAVATFAVHTVTAILSKAAVAEGTPIARNLIRRLFHLPGGPPDSSPPRLSQEEARQVRDATVAHAQALGLTGPQADLLADAVIGSLVTGA